MKRAGFTLIEVLCAVTILGVALFVLLGSQWSSLNIHSIMNEEVTLGQLVETIAGKAEIGVLEGTLNDSGDFGTRYPDYTWTYDAEVSGESDDPENQLYEVRLSVQGPQSNKELTLFVYNNNPDAESESGMFGNGGGKKFGQGSGGAGARPGGMR